MAHENGHITRGGGARHQSVSGNGDFIYFPAIPEFVTGKKHKQDIVIDIRPFLKRRNIRLSKARSRISATVAEPCWLAKRNRETTPCFWISGQPL